MELLKSEWDGSPILIILSHADTVAKLADDGYNPPTIPPGCNTVSWYYQDQAGNQCLVINQSGFARELQDNEQEVNGCFILICIDETLDLIDARAKLEQLYQQFSKTDKP